MEFNLFLPQMRLSFDDLVARAPCRRSRRLRRDHRHGPPGPAAGRRPADVRGDGHVDVAGRAHRAAADRLARAVRRLPPSRGARPPGRLDRPCIRRSLRARHRMGFGARRVRDVRCRFRRAARACRSLARDAGSHARVVGRRGRRLRRSLSPAARRAAGAAAARPHPDPDRRHRPEDARTRARVRRLVERPRRSDPQDRGAATEGRRRARVDPANGRADRT